MEAQVPRSKNKINQYQDTLRKQKIIRNNQMKYLKYK